MISKPSGLDLKYKNLSTEDAIREYERDTMLWEIYANATHKEFNPLTDFKATYYPDIDDEEYDEDDYDTIEIMRNKLGKLLDKKDHYESQSEYQDTTIGVCLTLLAIIGAICSGATTYISTELCILVALITPLFFFGYYQIKKENAKRKLVVTKKQISALKKEIKAMKKK